jgi:hypothetical protein
MVLHPWGRLAQRSGKKRKCRAHGKDRDIQAIAKLISPDFLPRAA